ncbi:MAG TPA: TIGR01777 family oxidoreductase [Gemmatimonadales bacterium]|nr:TIGR01777 family oxidoreductase [Gemmatimonadales bacterium]
MTRRYTRSSPMPVPVEELFDWHLRPGAFERLAPPWERADVMARTGPVADGAVVTLHVPIGPVSVRWVSRHRDVHRPSGFVDEQLSGPFASWVHAHRMEPSAAGGSTLTDDIAYALPFGPVGAIAAGGVRRKLERVFAYRHRITRGDLAAHASFRDRPRLHVAITGASGFIGRALEAFLTTGGHRVTRLVRRAPAAGEVRWAPDAAADLAPLGPVDAVIHLAGEGIATARWSTRRKSAIATSRQRGTANLVASLLRLAAPPPVLVTASAIGIYGDRDDDELTEASPVGTGFLADVGRAWEAASAPAEAAGIRVVRARLGIVLSPDGGALRKMLPPFRLGIGGRLGSGRQWMSWVALDDAIGAIHHAIFTPSLRGPVNVTAPAPATNAEFTATLARVLARPAILPVPAAALTLVFGQLADEALLAGQRVLPAALLAAGYRFRDPVLEGALRHVLGRTPLPD